MSTLIGECAITSFYHPVEAMLNGLQVSETGIMKLLETPLVGHEVSETGINRRKPSVGMSLRSSSEVLFINAEVVANVDNKEMKTYMFNSCSSSFAF